MSFSSELKAELLDVYPKSRHCRMAELAGIISISGRFEVFQGEPCMIIRTETDAMEDKICRLIRMVTENSSEAIIKSNENKHHRKLIVADKALVDSLMLSLKLKTFGEAGHERYSVDRIVTERSCCKKSYIRGAFLAGGAIGSPEKSNQLEIAALSKQEAERLCDDFEVLGLAVRSVKRRDRYIVYIKDGNTISNLIGLMGAPKTLMEYENIRIMKDVRNNINREVNCDAANMAKTAGAAAKQIEDIRYIKETVGLESLSDQLREMAEIRSNNPYLSMKELGECFTPPIGKSGISHRLRRLSEIAADLRDKEKK